MRLPCFVYPWGVSLLRGAHIWCFGILEKAEMWEYKTKRGWNQDFKIDSGVIDHTNEIAGVTLPIACLVVAWCRILVIFIHGWKWGSVPPTTTSDGTRPVVSDITKPISKMRLPVFVSLLHVSLLRNHHFCVFDSSKNQGRWADDTKRNAIRLIASDITNVTPEMRLPLSVCLLHVSSSRNPRFCVFFLLAETTDLGRRQQGATLQFWLRRDKVKWPWKWDCRSSFPYCMSRRRDILLFVFLTHRKIKEGGRRAPRGKAIRPICSGITKPASKTWLPLFVP